VSINLERSIHPDLLEETLESLDQTSTTPPSPRSRRGRRGTTAAPTELSPPGDAQPPVDGAEGDSGEARVSPSSDAAPPEWLESVRTASDPREMLKLLVKNAPRDEMEQDDVLRGWLGDAAQQRARKMLEDQDRLRQDRDRQQAFDRGDLYTLGQLDASAIQAQRQAADAQAQAAANPYMQGIRSFQAGLPESVQREVQGRNYDSFGSYLQAVHESAIRHGLEEEVKKREPALRKAELSTTVGSEMTPELDGGPAQAYREITDAQVAAMTLEEYDRYFDDKGRPRPGVRVQLTRGIDVRREQRR